MMQRPRWSLAGVGLISLAGLVHLVGASQTGAIPFSLLTAPGPSDASLFVAPVVYKHDLEGPMHPGDLPPPPPGNTHWYIAQWNNPAPLNPAGAAVPPGPGPAPCSTAGTEGIDWFTATPTMRVCLHNPDAKGRRMVELAQTGAASGTNELQCGKEFDAFVSPDGGAYQQPAGLGIGIKQSPPLSQLAALNATFGAEIVFANVTARCGVPPQCGGSGKVDYGYATLGVVLGNAAAKQTIFYQVQLYDTRRGNGCSGDPCGDGRNWYFKTNPFGVSDGSGRFKGIRGCMVPRGGRVPANFNVLPALIDAIKNGPPGAGLNANVSAWTANSLYLGVGLQGSVSHTMLLDSVDLIATLK